MKGTPKRLGRSFWSLLKGQIFLLLQWNVLDVHRASFGTLAIFSYLQLSISLYLYGQINETPHRKKKNINSILPLAFFFFYTFQTHKEISQALKKTAVVCWERSMLYILLYYHVEKTNPSKIKPRSACQVANTTEGSAYLYGRLILILFFSDSRSCSIPLNILLHVSSTLPDKTSQQMRICVPWMMVL